MIGVSGVGNVRFKVKVAPSNGLPRLSSFVTFNEVLDDSTNWVHAFQQTFHSLTVRQQQAIFHSISKYITLSHFVFMRDEIFFLFRIVNYSHLEQAAPNYYKRFLVFWDTFCQKSPHLDTNLFRLKSFTLMTYFSPLVAPLAPLQSLFILNLLVSYQSI